MATEEERAKIMQEYIAGTEGGDLPPDDVSSPPLHRRPSTFHPHISFQTRPHNGPH